MTELTTEQARALAAPTRRAILALLAEADAPGPSRSMRWRPASPPTASGPRCAGETGAPRSCSAPARSSTPAKVGQARGRPG